MASCPKCGKRIKHKRKSTGLKECSRHGPIEKLSIMSIPPSVCKQGLIA